VTPCSHSLQNDEPSQGDGSLAIQMYSMVLKTTLVVIVHICSTRSHSYMKSTWVTC